MKKILVILFSIILFVSCSSTEEKAKKNMRAYFEFLAKNPESLKISNVETLYKSDSCVAIQLITKGQNGFGGYSSSSHLYFYVVFDKINMQSSICTSSDKDLEKAIAKKMKQDLSNPDSAKYSIMAYTILFGNEVK